MTRLLASLCLFACMTATAPPLRAETTFSSWDAHVMGAGRWTCEDVLRIANAGPSPEFFQLAGWILGAWSWASLHREPGFDDIVETVGGEAIFRKTLDACAKASGSTILFRVTKAMVDQTNPQQE